MQVDRRGGCCIARYLGSGGGAGAGGGVSAGGFYDMSKVDRIMLKFRPIAPKPVSAGSGSGASTTDNSDGYVKCGRGKRKYVRVNGSKKKKGAVVKRRKLSVSSSPTHPGSDSGVSGGGEGVVTLSLLPETPDRKENSPVSGSPSENSDLLLSQPTNRNKNSTIWLNFNNQQQTVRDCHVQGENGHMVSDQPVVVIPSPQRPQVVSFVTVECVTETWLKEGGGGVRCRDGEGVLNMERDTCPGFISDGQDRVVWSNKAYRDMAGVGHVEEMVVVLDNRVTLPVAYPGFTCKVKVTCGGHRSPSSRLTVPCDVWRMDNGGYAWRLDVKAALSLGR